MTGDDKKALQPLQLSGDIDPCASFGIPKSQPVRYANFAKVSTHIESFGIYIESFGIPKSQPKQLLPKRLLTLNPLAFQNHSQLGMQLLPKRLLTLNPLASTLNPLALQNHSQSATCQSVYSHRMFSYWASDNHLW